MQREHDNVTRVSLTEPQNRLTTDFHFTFVSCQSIEHSNPSFFFPSSSSSLCASIFLCSLFHIRLHFHSVSCIQEWTTRHWNTLVHTRQHTNTPSSVSDFIGNPCIGAIPNIPLRFNVCRSLCECVGWCVRLLGTRVIWRTYHIQCNNGKQRQTLVLLRICVPCSANITNGKKWWRKREHGTHHIFSMYGAGVRVWVRLPVCLFLCLCVLALFSCYCVESKYENEHMNASRNNNSSSTKQLPGFLPCFFINTSSLEPLELEIGKYGVI